MNARERIYLVLSSTFVTCLVVADIIGCKLFKVGSAFGTDFYQTCGMISFPVTFIVTDIVNEYYGGKATRRLTYVGLAMAALAFGIIYAARTIPAASISPISTDEFDKIFGMSNRLYIASLSAYMVGQLIDIAIFRALKRWTGGKAVWLRATGSTIVSQALDSFVVTTILFYGADMGGGKTGDWTTVAQIGIPGYVFKFTLAVGLTPLIYLGHGFIQRQFGMTPLPPDSE